MEVTLTAGVREQLGSGPARRLRYAGQVPGVVYGHGESPLAVSVSARELSAALHTEAGSNVIINLDVAGRKIMTVTREVQRNAVRRTIDHVDFIVIDRTTKIAGSVPVHVEGTPEGVRLEGGRLDLHLREVNVEALPQDMPTDFTADVSGLRTGDFLRAGDLELPEGVTLLTDPIEVIAVVTGAAALEAEMAELEAAEAAAAPEEVAPEPEEAAAGEPAPEGEPPAAEG